MIKRFNILCKNEIEFVEVQKYLLSLDYRWLGTGNKIFYVHQETYPVIMSNNIDSNKNIITYEEYNQSYKSDYINSSIFLRKNKLEKINGSNL